MTHERAPIRGRSGATVTETRIGSRRLRRDRGAGAGSRAIATGDRREGALESRRTRPCWIRSAGLPTDRSAATSNRAGGRESEPDGNRYVFAYTITVSNHGAEPAQLMSRYWLITNGDGKTEEVEGPGVVGKQPNIAPNESFRYTSAAVLETAVGTMEGHYEFVAEDGNGGWAGGIHGGMVEGSGPRARMRPWAPEGYCGSSTVSITWMTPLLVSMSAAVTVASFTETVPSAMVMPTSVP